MPPEIPYLLSSLGYLIGYVFLAVVVWAVFAILYDMVKPKTPNRDSKTSLIVQDNVPPQPTVRPVGSGIIANKYQEKRMEAQNKVTTQVVIGERLNVESQALRTTAESIETNRRQGLATGQAEALNYQEASIDIQTQAKLKEAAGLAEIELLKEQKKAELATKLAYQHKVRPELGAVESLQEKLDKLIDEREKLKLDKPLGWEDKVAIRQKTIDALMEQLTNTHKQLNA